MSTLSFPLRSMLFTPGNQTRRVEKALTLNADAVILDLEDAVASSEKEQARAAVVASLTRRTGGGPRRYVRINASNTLWHAEDLDAIMGLPIDGIILPMAEHPGDVAAVAHRMTELEKQHGLAALTMDLIPIIETGAGLAAVHAIAAVGSHLRCLAFGAADFVVDMNMRWTRDEAELTPARAEIAVASRAAGLAAPVDSVWTRLQDAEGLVNSANRVRDLGYQGKLCIHPDQLGPVHAAFTPDAEEVAFADKVIAAFDEAEAAGSASISVEGHFVDYPIVERARRLRAFMNIVQSRENNGGQ